jgi:IclR family pca regulon transcriptional regulator
LRSRHFINSIEKAFEILKTFSIHGNEQSISEIADACRMAIGSVHRYLYTLKELGYVQQDPVSKRYGLTLKVLDLGFTVLKGMDLRKRVLPFMIEATRSLEVNSQCAILDGTEVVYIERVRSKNVVDLDIGPGYRLPAHCTSMGKVLLAFTEEKRREVLLEKMEMISLTPFTITSKKKLRSELHAIKESEFAICDRELNEGVYAVAAPIFRESFLEGAVGLSLSVQRAAEPGVKESMIATVLEISKKASTR